MNEQWLILRDKASEDAHPGTSPDIILGDAKLDPKYAEEYDKLFEPKIDFNNSNFVYVRAKNNSSALAIGDVTVYVTHLGDLLQQGLWSKLHTRDGRSSTNIGSNAGAVSVTGVPLIWEPNGMAPQASPYCLIAEISGDDYPDVKVPAEIKDKESFDAWIATEPRLAYFIVEQKTVIVTPKPMFTWTLDIDLANEAPQQLGAALTVTSGSIGGSVAYVFDKYDSNGKAIGIGDTEFALGISYSQNRMVPSHFASKVTIKYTPSSDDSEATTLTFQLTTDTPAEKHRIGTSSPKVLANYTLRFEQTKAT